MRVGCAPDTVLGTGTQTAREAVDDGRLGTPVAATAFMITPGHEPWHPDPEFYYQPGGGPLLDMGPYYLTALVTCSARSPGHRRRRPARRPSARSAAGRGPGERFPVEVATHVTGVLEHAGGALSTLIMSFDIWAAQLPRIEVHGDRGLAVGARPERLRRGRSSCSRPAPGSRCRSRRATGAPGAAPGWPTWPARWPTAARTWRRPKSPSTSST